jgi:hypothetical protein
MALAPVVLRLRSFFLTSPSAGITVRSMCFFSFQSPSPARHRAYATDDKNDRKDAEDQDVEHAALDHVPFRIPQPVRKQNTGVRSLTH